MKEALYALRCSMEGSKNMSSTRSKRDLKQEIADAFIEIAIQNGPDKVCVLDITKAVGINKNSFYYHFASKYHVAYWIFRSDMANMLNEHFESDQLVYLEEGSDKESKSRFSGLPYYVRIPQGARMLDQGPFFKQTILCLRKRREFYSSMLQDSSLDNLKSYMEALYQPAFNHDIELLAAGRYLPPMTQKFLAGCYLKMFLGMVEELVCQRDMPEELLNDEKNPFWNLATESISEAIRNHPIKSTDFTFKPRL